ncbi:uncharacterized protein LOC120339408 isoform X2 [Styela clava]
MPPKTGREYARLIKPTRNHAPTEYNLQYKRWPQHATEIRKDSTSTNVKGKLVRAGRIWSSSKPRKRSTILSDTVTTSYPKSSDSVTGKAATCDSDSVFGVLSCTDIDNNNGDLSKSLQTTQAQLHTRPELSVQIDPTKSYERERKTRTRQENICALGKASAPIKKAWLTKEEEENYQKELQDDISAKLRCMSVYSGIASSHATTHSQKSSTKESRAKTIESCKLSLSDEALKKTNTSARPQSLVEYCKNPTKNTSCDSIYKNTTENSHEDASSDWRFYYPQEVEHSPVPCLKSGGKVPPKSPPVHEHKKRKLNLGDGIDVDNLRKIYTNATDEELKKLRRTFIGLLGGTHSRERVVRKQYTSTKEKLPLDVSGEPMTKEDFDKIRVSSFRGSQKVVGHPHKDTWISSYNLDYCRKWSDTEVKEHFKSNELPEEDENNGERSITARDSGEKEEDENSEKANEKEQSAEITTTTPTREDDGNAKRKQRASEDERILKEANAIEEREFRKMFREDGEPKMKFETTSAQTYKGLPCRKPEEPVWAHKTLVSLGSGHWNTLWEHYDGWELENDISKKKVQDTVPKKRSERNKYKIKIYEHGEPCTPRNQCKKKVYGNYGGGIQKDRKTNVSFMTEYMRKFTQMPLPKKHVRI